MYTHEKPHSLEKSTTYTDAQDSKRTKFNLLWFI
jgi:hypothetical protein